MEVNSLHCFDIGKHHLLRQRQLVDVSPLLHAQFSLMYHALYMDLHELMNLVFVCIVSLLRTSYTLYKQCNMLIMLLRKMQLANDAITTLFAVRFLEV